MAWKKDPAAIARQVLKAHIAAADKLPKADRTAQKVTRATPISRKRNWSNN